MKKLQLNKETLLQLSSAEAIHVDGAQRPREATGQTICLGHCETLYWTNCTVC